MNVAAIAQRFPLVARPRPTCPFLAERVGQIREMARTAHTENDQASAAAVQNMAALIDGRSLAFRHLTNTEEHHRTLCHYNEFQAQNTSRTG
ncbi:hypothetical protein AB0C84_43885 [Actinomadura sp. NPDC048955]|uniref:hypothetical protein n=1 Tax=Actinomadura sp. NPDC048955 TaxID=3158228 RepID=UPI0034031548